MKISDYIAEFISQRTDHAFVGNGGYIIHLLDSLDKKEGFNLIPFVNEQGASIAAEAYYRVTKKPGVAIATSGPGFVNLIQGIACAYYDSIPALYITGAPATGNLKNQRKVRQIGFQEMEVITVVDSFVKYAVCLKDPTRIRYELERLWWESLDGRPGPVLIDIPDEIFRAEVDPNALIGFDYPKKKETKVLSISVIQKIRNAIQSSSRPLIIVGSGVKLANAEKEAVDFIKRTNIPCVTSWPAIDLFDGDFDQLVGSCGTSANRPGNFATQSCDLLISLGCRLNGLITGNKASNFATNAQKIMVDIEDSEINKENGVVIDIPINMNLKNFFDCLSHEDFNIGDISIWRDRINTWKKRYPICRPEYYSEKKYVNPYVFMETLSQETKKDTIIIVDTGATLVWTMQGYMPKTKQTLFTDFNHSTMGYSFPASIGVKAAKPNCEVICIIGDGGFNMNLQELGTLALQNLPIKIFILNNKSYGLIKQSQKTWLKSRYVCVDIDSGVASPDFIKIAKAYNIKTKTIDSHNNLEASLKYVLEYNNGPILCDVIVDSNQEALPKSNFERSIEDMYPYLSKSELEENMNFDS
jgi:acetolactate synthase I/II/III large subunit